MKYQMITILLLSMLLLGCQKGEEATNSDEISKSIQAFQNRKIYTKLDIETLNKINDENLEIAILDYIDSKVGNDYENQYLIITNLSKGFQAIYTTWEVEAEVNNGGFNQYFWNSTGEFANEAIEGFKQIKAEEFEKIMKGAVATAISENKEMKKFRDKGTIEAFSESYKHTSLNTYDDEFYNCKENLSALRIKYIRDNPELFVGN